MEMEIALRARPPPCMMVTIIFFFIQSAFESSEKVPMEILQTSGDKVLLPCEGNSDVVVEGEEKSEQMNITEQPQFMWNGISLTYLQDFLLLCDPNGREGIVDLTTGDIVEKFIKPATVVSQKSYCDMLLEQPEDCATFDVIHQLMKMVKY